MNFPPFPNPGGHGRQDESQGEDALTGSALETYQGRGRGDLGIEGAEETTK